MLQVLFYHAWTIGSPIGVDSFIMISAFLMTSSFVRRSERGAMPNFLERWAHTFKRLLPPLTLVILTTLGAVFFLFPATRWKEMVTQAFASQTYWENWRLVEVAADYYAADHSLQSPFQHLWSMSMQGQMFLAWPVIMTLCVLLAKAVKIPIRATVATAFGLITVLSLLWLLFLAPSDGSIYFDTRARIWEFAFGSMIAALAPYIRLPRGVAQFLAWAGFAVLIAFCLIPIGTYPGPMAFFPMGAVSLILLFSSEEDKRGTGRTLAWKPLVWLGNISYAVYLVHWPLFIFYLTFMGYDRLSVKSGFSLIALSLGIGYLVTRFLDDPLRSWKWANRAMRNKWTVVVLSLIVGLLPIGAAHIILEKQANDFADSVSSVDHPGAAAIGSVQLNRYEQTPIPGPLSLGEEWLSYPDGCNPLYQQVFPEPAKGQSCTKYGQGSEKHVLIVGDSHAEQNLLPVFSEMADTDDELSAEAILTGGCRTTMPRGDEKWCDKRNRGIIDYIEVASPDYVALVATRVSADSPEEELLPGIEELIQHLTDRGITVLAFRDNLRSEEDLYECSAERPADQLMGGCLLDQNQYLAATNPALELEGPNVHVFDVTDLLCIEGTCPTIMGNVHIYLDGNHLTKAYSQTMAPIMAQRVREALGN